MKDNDRTDDNDNNGQQLSPLGAEMVEGLAAFCDALEAGEPLETRYTVRTVKLDLDTTPYGPDDVKALRGRFHASQALFARFLGVSVKTLRSWEQGQRPVPGIARRYLDDLRDHPDLWGRRVRVAGAGQP